MSSSAENNQTTEDSKVHETPNVSKEYIDIVYDSLCDMLEDGKVNLLDTAQVVLGLMQLVEEYDDLHGKDKKDLILYVLNKYNESHPDSDNFITSSLEGFINVMIGIDRGELVIQIQPEKCLDACFGCMMSSTQKKRKDQAKKLKKKKELQKQIEKIDREMVNLK